jgi:hypothetical protein
VTDLLVNALQHLLELLKWRRDRRMTEAELLARAGRLVGPSRPRITAR